MAAAPLVATPSEAAAFVAASVAAVSSDDHMASATLDLPILMAAVPEAAASLTAASVAAALSVTVTM